MLPSAILAGKLTLDHPPKQANPFTSIRLQPLCPSQKSQPQSNHHLPASFSKTPGVGGTPFLATRHSPLDSHTPRPSYSNELFGKEARQNLCGTMRLMRVCRTKPKIPIVAIFASQPPDHHDPAHASLNHTFSPPPPPPFLPP